MSEESTFAFSFGEPEALLQRSDFIALLQVTWNDRWYEPPISMAGLAKAQRMSPHHASAMTLKRNLLMKSFIPNRLLSRQDFGRVVQDFLATGNLYLERIDSLAGTALGLKPAPAIGTRVGRDEGVYWFVKAGEEDHQFRPGTICHVMSPDIAQEIYGVPEWYAALDSGLLNNEATLFRRKYFKNGAHAGFMMYISEEGLSDKDAEAIKAQLKAAKGPGNFRNLFVHIPKGKKDGVQILPIAEVAASDQFLGIKNTTRDDVLAAHRTPPQLIGVVPTNNAGFGSIREAALVFFDHEIVPLQMQLLAVNDWLGLRAVQFADPADTLRPAA